MGSDRHEGSFEFTSRQQNVNRFTPAEMDVITLRTDRTRAQMEVYYTYEESGQVNCMYIFRWPTTASKAEITDIVRNIGSQHDEVMYYCTDGQQSGQESFCGKRESEKSEEELALGEGYSPDLDKVLVKDYEKIGVGTREFTIISELSYSFEDPIVVLGIIATSTTPLSSRWFQVAIQRSNPEMQDNVARVTAEFDRAFKQYELTAQPIELYL